MAVLVMAHLPGAEGFSFSNCDRSAPIQISSASLKHDPVNLRAENAIDFLLQNDIELTVNEPLKITFKVSKKMWSYVKMPCTRGVGSCTYDLWSLNAMKDVPHQLPAAIHQISLPLSFGQVSMPSFLVNGKYRIEAEVRKDGK
eukprot:UN23878